MGRLQHTTFEPLPALFQPLRVGSFDLSHRVVLAPLTRVRANKAHIPARIAAEYYAQRASEPGSLLITEATFIAPQAGGESNVPGIWNDEQIIAWKRITDAVHAKGSFTFLQLWAMGREADPKVLQEEGGYPYVSSSDVPRPEKQEDVPRPLTVEEIQEYVQIYAVAASNAVHKANFDGVEIHGASGHLIEQFLRVDVNKRQDRYGADALSYRTRFALEIVDAVAKVVSPEKVGIRLSPWNAFEASRRPSIIETYSYLVSQIRERYPSLAYLSIIEHRPRRPTPDAVVTPESNDFIRDIWGPRPIISAGGYVRQKALDIATDKGDLIAFGRLYISNPDLPRRLKKNIDLTPYDYDTFYLPGDESGRGYTDYSFAD